MTRTWPIITSADECTYSASGIMCTHPMSRGPCDIGYCPLLGYKVHEQILKQKKALASITGAETLEEAISEARKALQE